MPARVERVSADGSSINPGRALQFSENAKTGERRNATGECGLPEGARLSQSNFEAIVSFPGSLSSQARFCVGPSDSFRLEQKHMNKQFQFVYEPIFQTKEHQGRLASLFCRVPGWSSGARRRETTEPTAFMTAGDPVKLIIF